MGAGLRSTHMKRAREGSSAAPFTPSVTQASAMTVNDIVLFCWMTGLYGVRPWLRLGLSHTARSMSRCGNAENVAVTAKERRKLAPKSLPSNRPRSLTPPLPSEPLAGTPTTRQPWYLFKRKSPPPRTQLFNGQTQSALFSKLPKEVRLRIWHLTFGQQLLHVVRRPQRLTAIECSLDCHLPSKNLPYHRCWGVSSRQIQLGPTPGFYGGQRTGSSAAPIHLVAPLTTCRLLYSEAISILYQDNVFAFNHLDTVLSLSRTILPDRFDSIRTITLQWNFKWPLIPEFEISQPLADDGPPAPYNYETWRQTCQLLSRIKDLRSLSLFLSGGAIPLSPGPFQKWIEPVLLIRPSVSFHVTLPSSPPEPIDTSSWPFQLQVEPH
ncbi:hypothetical protein FH972_023269 [Carpinus fangiana]|uniref:DUF7730 domain-containing protein n=1 Tax=Carpinus fangiana TaxID=176857 RepID=A0A5N6KV11_9ROSI|nr:hypothetical protein FH972_023269 [Carpinus fangiana]